MYVNNLSHEVVVFTGKRVERPGIAEGGQDLLVLSLLEVTYSAPVKKRAIRDWLIKSDLLVRRITHF